MSPSQLPGFRLVAAAGLVLAAGPGGELQVLRVSPGTEVGARWTLVPGTHRIGALGTGGQRAEVSITVE